MFRRRMSARRDLIHSDLQGDAGGRGLKRGQRCFAEKSCDGRDIADDISKRLPVTAALAVFGTLVSAIFGIVMGVTAAVRGGAADRVITVLSGILLSLPAFWVGVLLVYVFAVQLRLLPATGFVPFDVNPEAWARSLVLPVM